jgi:5,6-dimethylbenzimidazole synthase
MSAESKPRDTAAPVFGPAFQAELEALLVWRRDVRRFLSDPLPPGMLERLLGLADLAPSVGLSQPWRFVRVFSPEARASVRRNFAAANAEALADYDGSRAALYARLKLSGLDAAPEQLAVFAETEAEQGHGLGRRSMPETLHYSTVCAVHSLWLAARAAGIGVGWVSILDPLQIASDLEVPPTWDFVAFLCIGFPEEDHDDPELARRGWEQRSAAASRICTR